MFVRYGKMSVMNQRQDKGIDLSGLYRTTMQKKHTLNLCMVKYCIYGFSINRMRQK